MSIFTQEDNNSLDNIISTRHSIRAFKEDIPPKEKIEAVVEAGMKAPFASVSADDIDVFRHFFVVPRESGKLPEIDRLIREQSLEDLKGLNKEIESDQFIRDHSKILKGLWSMVAEKGIPGFTEVPYLVVAAEWAGARRAERQSLAHVMQNMWLKATALELGFCLVSPIESMMNNDQFCSLFDLPTGRYGFHGCMIGYSKQELDKVKGKPVTGKVEWL